jgi:integrase
MDLKKRVAVLVDTKNGDRRVIPLPGEVVEVLGQSPTPIRLWFPGWTLRKVDKDFSALTRRIGLTGVTFHTLRHTFASHAAMQGVDLYTLASLLGHRNLAMVKRYAHLAPAHHQTATELAAKAIFAGQVPRQVPQAQEKIA